MVDASPSRGTIADSLPTLEDDGEARLARGSLVGRYIVLEEVGAGGMGVVYAAYDPDLDRRVAVKLLRPRRSQSPDALTRMLREAQALGKLAHPNVVAVHDVGEARGGVFVAMEFVRGRTLGQWCQQEQPRWPRILEVMIAVGHGLAAAHDKGLVHRDIKPDNVMIDDDARVRVMDFGLARPSAPARPRRTAMRDDDDAVSGEPDVQIAPAQADTVEIRSDLEQEPGVLRSALTREGAIVGTPGYMAPEQFGGARIDAAADQFAYCITLWEALYGRRPFVASTVEAMAIAVTSGRIDPPPRGTEVPAWLHRVLLRGLTVDPADRWPSMRALLDAITLDPRPQRRRWMTIGAIAVGGVAVAGGVRWRQGSRVAACIDAGAAIDDRWNPAVAAGVRQGLVASGVTDPDGTFARVTPWLDRYAERWRAAATDACEAATLEDRYDAPTYARAQDCLAERDAEFTELVRLLLAPSADTAREAVLAAADLTPIASCEDARQLVRAPMIGDEHRNDARAVRELLGRATAAANAGDPGAGLAQAEAALTEAERLGFLPLLARAHLEIGAAHVRLDHADRASTELREAYRQAASSGADEVAADAARRLVYVTGYQLEKREESSIWYDVATALHDRLDLSADDARRIALISERAAVRAVSGELLEAREDYEVVLAAMLAQLGEDHPNVVATLGALSVAQHQLDDHVAAEASSARALEILARIYGNDHPERAVVLAGYASVLESMGRHDDAVAAARAAVEIHENAFGPEHASVAAALNNLAVALGDTDEAVAAAERALAITQKVRGPVHREVGYCLNNLGYLAFRRGDFATAVKQHLRAAEVFAAIPDGDLHAYSQTLYNLGAAYDSSGQFAEAADAFARALPLAEAAFGPEHAFVTTARAAVGRARLNAGDPRGAIEPLEIAVANHVRLASPAADVARDQMYLARARWLQGGDEAVARAEITRALEVLAGTKATRAMETGRTWLAQP